ncbi:hypothetical protein JCM11491_005055 [Sporobolomyces phaffii]
MAPEAATQLEAERTLDMIARFFIAGVHQWQDNTGQPDMPLAQALQIYPRLLLAVNVQTSKVGGYNEAQIRAGWNTACDRAAQVGAAQQAPDTQAHSPFHVESRKDAQLAAAALHQASQREAAVAALQREAAAAALARLSRRQ